MKWTEEEQQLVRDNLHMTNQELEKLLNRTKASVRLFLAHHKLRVINKGPYSEKEDEYLRQNYLKLDNEQLGRALQRTANAISFKLKKLELYRPEPELPPKSDDMSPQELVDRARVVNANYLRIFGYKIQAA